MSFNTKIVHVGSEPHLSKSKGVNVALELSTTFEQEKIGIFDFEYARSSNPTRLALERLLASMEGLDHSAEEKLPFGIAFSSGSAATATVISGIAGLGGHVISISEVYGGTSRYLTQVASTQSGVETSFIDMSYSSGGELAGQETSEEKIKQDLKEDEEIITRIEAAIRPNTKLIWAETPTNPSLSLAPIALLAKIAKKHSIPLVIDNTFASSYYQNPLLLGASVVVHSLTKYTNGHSDVVGGAIISNDQKLVDKFRFLQNANGNIPSPFDCFLTIRGIKTLALRAKQHGLSALTIAKWLDTTGRKEGLVRDVFYPGLHRADETRGRRRERELAWDQLSPQAKKWIEKQGMNLETGFPSSGMVTFHINSDSPGSQTDSTIAEKFLESLKFFCLAESLGGVESLAELPLKMTHAGIPIERRRELRLDAELIRLSVGVEEEEDLLNDIISALRLAVLKK